MPSDTQSVIDFHVEHTLDELAKKRLRLTGEILQSLGYEDLEVLELLQKGSTLAGEIETSAICVRALRFNVAAAGRLRSQAQFVGTWIDKDFWFCCNE